MTKTFLAAAVAAVLSVGAAGVAMAQSAPPQSTAAETPPPPAPPEGTPASEWRTVPAENLLVIDTTKGRILVEMIPEIAPGHVERMRLLARASFFDNLKWHRVIDYFMAQTGDPLGTGDGQSAWPDLKAEFTFRRGPETPFQPAVSPTGGPIGFLHALPVQTQPDALMAQTSDHKVHGWGLYCPGVAGMARDDNPDSANSQFFIMRQAYPSLDKRYTVWGVAVSGLDVVRSLNVGTDASGIVASPDMMTRVRVASDLPEGERPTAQVLDTASPRYRELVQQVRDAKGADFSVCDVTLPVQVSGGTPAA
jgi:peptidylprolyl isomerase